MPLVPCPACQREVSTAAAACPHCGHPLVHAALGFGLALAPQQAQAACTVSPAATPVTGTVTCADTTTGDSTYAGVSPATDRNYNVDTSAGDVTGTVSAGATVDGFGLSFTNTVGGANDIIIVNNGAVENDSGNVTPVNGVDAALTRSSQGRYLAIVNLNEAGEWRFRWETTGTYQGAKEFTRYVDASEFS